MSQKADQWNSGQAVYVWVEEKGVRESFRILKLYGNFIGVEVIEQANNDMWDVAPSNGVGKYRHEPLVTKDICPAGSLIARCTINLDIISMVSGTSIPASNKSARDSSLHYLGNSVADPP